MILFASLRVKHAALAAAGAISALGACAFLWASGTAESLFQQGREGTPACATCHGAQGEGGGGGMYPRIAGQPAAYVENQLKDFRDGRRANPLMAPMVAGLTDADAQAVAAYVEGLNAPRAQAQKPDAVQAVLGQALVTVGAWERGVPPCAGCHGPALEGVTPNVPGLARQWPQYLAAQLSAWQQGQRAATPLGLMAKVAHGMTAAEIAAVSAYIGSLPDGEVPGMPRPEKPEAWTPAPQSADNFVPPPDAAIPAGPYGDLVRYGQSIFEQTSKYAGEYSRNGLSCRNCHLDRGRLATSGPMWAAYVHYPEYRKKDGLVNTMQMRIQGCFRYSQNGVVPAADSKEVTALVTYFHWLATGLPTGIKPKAVGYPRLAAPEQKPRPERGARVYAANCALCHGEDGQGRKSGAHPAFPPLWGPQSFNWGAGMHQVDMAAAFIKANMPYGAGNTLSDQDAWDVSAYMNSRPRPQDPRFVDDTEKTREKFHANHEFDFYGKEIDDVLLGGNKPLEK
ncbi:MAG TPA: c-type cytochrome [Burkholderiales bacterium]|nr:c-type cytochrome [Burkholderiales bacterium]